MQKQIWHRSNNFQNRENFWKEFFSRATENNPFWFVNNPMAPAALPQRNIRCSSTLLVLPHLRHSGWIQAGGFTAATAAQSSALVLHLFLWTSNPDICPEVPPVNLRWMRLCWWAAAQLVSGVPPWPLTDEMKEPHPAWNKKSLHQHRVSPSVFFFPAHPEAYIKKIALTSSKTSLKKKKRKLFCTWFTNPCKVLNSAAFFPRQSVFLSYSDLAVFQ